MKNKLNDYKKMDEKTLINELKALKNELFKLRLSHAMNGLDNPNKITETKRNIARVNTILTIIKNGGTVTVKEYKTSKKAIKKNDLKKELKDEAKSKEKKEAKKETKKVSEETK